MLRITSFFQTNLRLLRLKRSRIIREEAAPVLTEYSSNFKQLLVSSRTILRAFNCFVIIHKICGLNRKSVTQKHKTFDDKLVEQQKIFAGIVSKLNVIVC